MFYSTAILLTVCDTSFYDAGGPNNIYTSGSFYPNVCACNKRHQDKILFGLEVSNFAILDTQRKFQFLLRIEAVSGNENRPQSVNSLLPMKTASSSGFTTIGYLVGLVGAASLVTIRKFTELQPMVTGWCGHLEKKRCRWNIYSMDVAPYRRKVTLFMRHNVSWT